MFFIILIITILGFFIYFNLNYKIDYKSLFKKGLPLLDDRFGVYFITGKQGTFKSFYATRFLLEQDRTLCNKVKTNMKSLNIPGYKIEYFDHIEDIYKDFDPYCIYYIDEIAQKYGRNAPCDRPFYAWLNQSRKTHRIVIMITQEWKELPMWLRRPARFMFTTIKNPLLNKLFKIRQTVVGDAENMYMDEDMEWVCPTIKRILWKPNLYITKMYDTFECVSNL